MRTYWYTTPRFFVLEWLATHAVLVPIIIYLARIPWVVDVPAAAPAAAAAAGTRPRRHWAAAAFVMAVRGAEVAAVVPAVAIVAYKLPSGRVAYLAQPCHLQNFLLVGLMPTGWHADAAPHSDTTAARIFHFFLSTWYSALLALATPDLRGQTMFLEIENFFAQHWLLLLLPTLWLLRRRFTLYAGVHPWVLCWLVFWLAHLDVFVPVSLASGRNINYVLVPPPVGLLRRHAGLFYRPAVGFITGESEPTATLWGVEGGAVAGCGGWVSSVCAGALEVLLYTLSRTHSRRGGGPLLSELATKRESIFSVFPRT